MGLSRTPHAKVMTPGLRFMIKRSRRINQLILDYAIGVAAISLLPFDGTLMLELKLLITAGLIGKMIYDIGRIWGRPRWRPTLAFAGNLLGGLAAFSTALLAWLTLFCLSLLFPPLKTFALAAALFTLTWGLGRNTHQFYVSAMTHHIDRRALKHSLEEERRRERYAGK